MAELMTGDRFNACSQLGEPSQPLLFRTEMVATRIVQRSVANEADDEPRAIRKHLKSDGHAIEIGSRSAVCWFQWHSNTPSPEVVTYVPRFGNRLGGAR